MTTDAYVDSGVRVVPSPFGHIFGNYRSVHTAQQRSFFKLVTVLLAVPVLEGHLPISNTVQLILYRFFPPFTSGVIRKLHHKHQHGRHTYLASDTPWRWSGGGKVVLRASIPRQNNSL
jgi:hypothetical protein